MGGTQACDYEREIQAAEAALFLAVPSYDRSAVEATVAFMKERHTGQERPGGEPQILHALRVAVRAAQFASIECPDDLLVLVQAALCHDLLEDTETTDADLEARFGRVVARTVRAVSLESEDEPDEVWTVRVKVGGRLAILTKRFDRLDNIAHLGNAPADFRQMWLPQVRANLAFWRPIDPDGADQIEEILTHYAE